MIMFNPRHIEVIINDEFPIIENVQSSRTLKNIVVFTKLPTKRLIMPVSKFDNL